MDLMKSVLIVYTIQVLSTYLRQLFGTRLNNMQIIETFFVFELFTYWF